MLSKTLLAALSLCMLTTSSVLGAAAHSSPASSTVTFVTGTSSSGAASNIAAGSSTSRALKGKSGKDKGGAKSTTCAGAGAASSAVSSASVAAASSTANAAAASSSAATGTSASGSGDDPQTATTLAQAVIATGFAQDGQQVPAAGQVASLTSTNDFINFCMTVNMPITNSQQITTGPFLNPTNSGTIKANTSFMIQMAINNIETGNFVNAKDDYYAAPPQLNSDGIIIGHAHAVVEQLDSLNQRTLTDPNKFAFFKGINGAAVNGVLSANFTDGLPAGAYHLASINAAMNHQPVLVAVARHGSLDDMVYFIVE